MLKIKMCFWIITAIVIYRWSIACPHIDPKDTGTYYIRVNNFILINFAAIIGILLSRYTGFMVRATLVLLAVFIVIFAYPFLPLSMRESNDCMLNLFRYGVTAMLGTFVVLVIFKRGEFI